MDEQLPSLSIVIPTLNSAGLIEQCLSSIAAQDYPRERVEVLVMDGGSTDETAAIARAYGADVIVSAATARDRDNAESRMALGLARARNDVVAYIMSDNFLPHPRWLREMVQPLIDDASIVSTQTLHYAYRRSDPPMSRYCALFGAGDPVAYYLDKRDRMSWAESSWAGPGTSEDHGDYYRVEFDTDQLPPLGCNGALVRRGALLGTHCAPDEFAHSDAMYELVEQGHRAIGFVKNDIVHYTRSTALAEARKRARYFRSLRPGWQVQRRYLLFNPASWRDRIRLAWFVFISLSLIVPCWDALRGYRRVPDRAWFIHPVYCLLITAAYGWALTQHVAATALRSTGRIPTRRRS